MRRETFLQLENYMRECMRDSAHDQEHVYRVLYFAVDIAAHESGVDRDVLIAACLLHDIGRLEQYQNPKLRHEEIGSRKAYDFLIAHDWQENRAAHVRDCVLTHRFRSEAPPESIEAQIVFDADKLDAAGTLGIARTLLYKGIVAQPLYTLDAQGNVSDGALDAQASFFREYKFKLEKLYGRFYTAQARQIADGRRASAEAFYQSMLGEVRACYAGGKQALSQWIE